MQKCFCFCCNGIMFVIHSNPRYFFTVLVPNQLYPILYFCIWFWLLICRMLHLSLLNIIGLSVSQWSNLSILPLPFWHWFVYSCFCLQLFNQLYIHLIVFLSRQNVSILFIGWCVELCQKPYRYPGILCPPVTGSQEFLVTYYWEDASSKETPRWSRLLAKSSRRTGYFRLGQCLQQS